MAEQTQQVLQKTEQGKERPAYRLSWKEGDGWASLGLFARPGKVGWSGKLDKPIPVGTYLNLFKVEEKAAAGAK